MWVHKTSEQYIANREFIAKAKLSTGDPGDERHLFIRTM